jgi:Fe-S-cluster containining protein
MNNSDEALDDISAKINVSGFTCIKCSACCTGHDAVIMVSPPEIRAIMQETDLEWHDIVTPYPEYIIEQSQKLTFGWALRQTQDQCIFLQNKQCTIYHTRPWICKTYPFMLDQECVITSACEGLRSQTDPLDPKALTQLLQDLIARKNAEEEEEAQIVYWYHIFTNTPSETKASVIVIDSEGIKPQN